MTVSYYPIQLLFVDRNLFTKIRLLLRSWKISPYFSLFCSWKNSSSFVPHLLEYHIFPAIFNAIVNDFSDASRDVVAVVDAAVVVAGYAATLGGRSMWIVHSG